MCSCKCVYVCACWPSFESWYRSNADDPRWADGDTGLHRGLISDVQQTHLEGNKRIIMTSVGLFAKNSNDVFISPQEAFGIKWWSSQFSLLPPKVLQLEVCSIFSPARRIHHCYTPTPRSRCRDSCGWERRTKTGDKRQYMSGDDFCTSVNMVCLQAWTQIIHINTLYSGCCSHLHSTTCLHYRNGLQKLWVPLVLIHC